MLDNITVLDDSKYYSQNIVKKSTKVVKLSTYDNVKNIVAELMAKARVSVPENKAEVDSNVAQTVATVAKEEVREELPFTPKEVLEAKKELFGITAYSDMVGIINPISSIQEVSRRLKTNPVVPGNINRERNVNGEIHKIVSNEINAHEDVEFQNHDEQPVTNTFDFQNINSELSSNFGDVTKPDDNRIDEWLNKDRTPVQTGDLNLDAVNSLKAMRDTTADSLATQKAILAGLRERIKNNEALCKQKKDELEQENMALTQELNEVLNEINQLSDIASQQEAFLGISSDNKNREI